jgi:GntR family transcriptional repressor for pyruvate dehydrogenase complex
MLTKEKKNLSHEIIRYILEHNVRQGDAIPSERKLSEILNASRNSVREALRKLEAQSVLEIKPGSGCYVKTSEIEILANPETDSRALVFQHLEARMAVDPDIMQLAAERINEREITQLKSQIVKLSRSILARDIMNISNDDNCFRMTLQDAQRTACSLMIRQLEKNNFILWQIVKDMSDEELNEIFGTYVKILNCIKKRDAGAAKNEVRNQITTIFNYLRTSPEIRTENYTETEVLHDQP